MTHSVVRNTEKAVAASNPYIPSQASLDAPGTPSVDPGPWREGNVLVMRHTSVLPERCVKCNQAAAGSRLHWRLYWVPSVYIRLAYLHWLLYLAVALFVHRKAIVSLGLCARHKSRRRWFLGLGALGFLGFLAMLRLADSVWLYSPALGQAGFILSVLSMFAGIAGSRTVFPDHIDAAYVRVHGCSEHFLDNFPRYWS